MRTLRHWIAGSAPTISATAFVAMLLTIAPADAQLTPPATPSTASVVGAAGAAMSGGLGAMGGGASAIVPPPATPTVFDFLGVPQMFRFVGKGVRKKVSLARRLLPFGDPPPPLQSEGGGAGYEGSGGGGSAGAGPGGGGATGPEPAPSAKAVAQNQGAVKAAKADAQALEFLATVGCGDCNPDVEPAFYHGLDSCFESVRAAAARSIRSVAMHGCAGCNRKSCCSPRIRERLMRIGYEADSDGCPVEPDPEVSRLARLALQCCQCIPLADDSNAPMFTEGPPIVPDFLPPPDESAYNRGESTVRLASTGSQPVPWARVNNEPIYASQILPRVDVQLHGIPPYDRERLRVELTQKTLQDAIDNRLIAQLARRKRFLSTETTHEMDELDRDARIADEYVRSQVQAVPIGDDELQRYFDANRERFRRGEAVLVEELKIPVRTRAEAQAIVMSLFDQASDQRTTTKSISREQLTVVKPRWLVIPDEEPPGSGLTSLRNGEVSRIVPDVVGFRVLRILQRRSPRLAMIQEVESQLRSEVWDQKVQVARTTLIKQLRSEGNFWDLYSGVHLVRNRQLATQVGDAPPMP